MTVKEVLAREYLALAAKAECLQLQLAGMREKLKKLLKVNEECGPIRCLRVRHLEAQVDALRASGDWPSVSREQVCPEKLAMLLKLKPEAATDGRVRVWYDKRLVAIRPAVKGKVKRGK